MTGEGATQPIGLNSESLLRGYDALILGFTWAFIAAALCMVFLYVLFLWVELSSFSRTPVARLSRTARSRLSISSGMPHHWPSLRQIADPADRQMAA